MGIFNFLFGSVSKQQPTLENVSLQNLIPKMKTWNVDTVLITTSKRCPVCKVYEQKIYSLWGWNKKYSKLPEFLYQRRCPECNCYISASMYFSGISTKMK